MALSAQAIRALVFDLDGTLYVSNTFAAAIQEATTGYIASLKSVNTEQAHHLIHITRTQMAQRYGTEQTLSAVCAELGGNVQDLHACFKAILHPEAYLVRDPRVIELLERLSASYSLYIFTNNNRTLSTRIINHLGIGDLFRHIYTIDDAWVGKPDQELLERILFETGLSPHEALFVGDRYDVDLRLPELHGCPVYLSQTIDQLLRIEELLKSYNSSSRDISGGFPNNLRIICSASSSADP